MLLYILCMTKVIRRHWQEEGVQSQIGRHNQSRFIIVSLKTMMSSY